jgi:hypothetical protein
MVLPLKLVADKEFVRTLQLDDGTLIDLRLDEHEMSVVATEKASGKGLGHLDFTEVEADDPHVSGYYKLIWAYLDHAGDKYKRSGLGREALKLWNETYGPAAVERHTGIPNSQGSHLTADAPGFVDQMVREKLLYYEAG